jgi:TPR repeat protein
MAQIALGGLYAKGQGVSQDYATAKQWYEKAAAQGLAVAQFNLGLLYAYGQVVSQDYTKARQWWEKAAAQGETQAQGNLGTLYANGLGVPQDDVRAYMWITLDMANSDGAQQKFTAEVRDMLARRMTPAQIEKAQRLSQQCQAQQFKGC